MGVYTPIDVTPREASAGVPTRLSALLFAAKASAHRVRRRIADLASGPRRLPVTEAGAFPIAVAVSRTPLWSDMAPGEALLQRGKVHNLRAAARRLDRTLLAPGAVFSFWAQLGRPSRRRGFVAGRMLQEGCLVPATGGGLCQLSNALYDVALRSGCAVIERHPHSRRIPGSAAAAGRDATVAWNYVDLRIQSDAPLMLRVQLEKQHLTVALFAAEEGGHTARMPSASENLPEARSCASCGQAECFRHEPVRAATRGRVAFCVDTCWPEFDAYIARTRTPSDLLCAPLDGQRWNRPQYGWTTQGFAAVHTATFATLRRAFASRRLAAQGAARQAALLDAARTLAAHYAKFLTPDVTSVCVDQALLPHLWRAGHLGGRTVSVLMTRLPMAVLQSRLDEAARAHPDSTTLADFRAPADLVAAEREALAAADLIITPHREIADLFGARNLRLDWVVPAAKAERTRASRLIAFPGPTAGRKGAYELREAARRLDLDVLLLGHELEGHDFWRGIRTHRATSPADMEGVAAVIQPAYLEDRPRMLLEALGAGIPVIATPACGLGARHGVTLVPAGDVDALVAALRTIL